MPNQHQTLSVFFAGTPLRSAAVGRKSAADRRLPLAQSSPRNLRHQRFRATSAALRHPEEEVRPR